jgi:hypothetical protein
MFSRRHRSAFTSASTKSQSLLLKCFYQRTQTGTVFALPSQPQSARYIVRRRSHTLFEVLPVVHSFA